MKLNSKNSLSAFIITIFVIFFGIFLNYSPQQSEPNIDIGSESATISPAETPTITENEPIESSPKPSALNPLTVHFIDVGQADCILIQSPAGKNMLIDAGNNADSDLILAYLREHKATNLDIVVGTHPHEDHIGSLDAVINACTVKKIYMPKLQDPPTSKTYRDVLTAIKNKGLTVTTAKSGTVLNFDPDITAVMLAPDRTNYESTNDYSAVIKLVYHQTSFLFTGDAETLSESIMLENDPENLRADILKAGHHGSRSSSSPEFLAAVKPKKIIISAGNNNRYGHPHQEILARMIEIADVYRTDKNGTIVIKSTGKDYQIETER